MKIAPEDKGCTLKTFLYSYPILNKLTINKIYKQEHH